jgi:hypothetical protein
MIESTPLTEEEAIKVAAFGLDKPRADREEQEWRKAIADQVRRNCTPSSEAYSKGGDFLIYAVADWIENPPEWSKLILHPAPVAVPLKLDPKPWMCLACWDRFVHRPEYGAPHMTGFKPRPGYSTDPADYSPKETTNV